MRRRAAVALSAMLGLCLSAGTLQAQKVVDAPGESKIDLGGFAVLFPRTPTPHYTPGAQASFLGDTDSNLRQKKIGPPPGNSFPAVESVQLPTPPGTQASTANSNVKTPATEVVLAPNAPTQNSPATTSAQEITVSGEVEEAEAFDLEGPAPQSVPQITGIPVPPLPAQTPPAPTTPAAPRRPSTGPTPPRTPIVAAPVVDFSTQAPVRSENGWANADLNVGFVTGVRLLPLATTSTPGTPQALAGVVNQPSTQILFGSGTNNDSARFGFRTELGTYLDDDRVFGIAIGGFLWSGNTDEFAAESLGDPILARPFINTNATGSNAVLVAFPGVTSGRLNIQSEASAVGGMHINISENFINRPNFQVDAVAGYKFLTFSDRLDIDEVLSPEGGAFVPGTRIDVFDRFSASNEFQGAEFGFKARYLSERWSLDGFFKMGVGSLSRHVVIDGGTTFTVPGTDPVFERGGMLALSSNIGEYHRRAWVILPQFDLTFQYRLNAQTNLRFGYNLMYMNRVARAGNQASQVLNENLFPPAVAGATPALPSFGLNHTDVMFQGLSFGIEYKF